VDVYCGDVMLCVCVCVCVCCRHQNNCQLRTSGSFRLPRKAAGSTLDVSEYKTLLWSSLLVATGIHYIHSFIHSFIAFSNFIIPLISFIHAIYFTSFIPFYSFHWLIDSFINSLICWTTGPRPPPKRVLHRVRASASCLKLPLYPPFLKVIQ
jgi:hypothetical protein